MKELTLKEVISIIKEGETWENQELIIYLVGDELNIDWKVNIDWKDEKPDGGICFYLNEKFRLQRNKVSFSEAFKAYEEGKEIESCVSDCKYLKKDKKDYYKYINDSNWEIWLNGGSFDFDEIRGKWYIN